MTKLLPILTLVLLAACSKADNEPGPGGVTMGEARALDEAADMIEARRLPADLVRQPAVQPQPAAPAPANQATAAKGGDARPPAPAPANTSPAR